MATTVSAPVHGIQGVLKDVAEFRNYESSARDELVSHTYRLNHQNQTLDFVLEQKKRHLTFQKGRMTLWEVFSKLEQLVDESDPDNDLPQIIHAYQTAEALRQLYPDKDYLHLVGLIHDLGKMLLLEEFGGLPQWCVVGDTFPVGCKHSSAVCKSQFFSLNPDSSNPLLNTQLGIYKRECGISNLIMSWGHDEYLYQVLRHNGCQIPEKGLSIIRFHSFFAWHKEGQYQYFMAPEDEKILKWCKRFSCADLYSKGTLPISKQQIENELEPYYRSLIEKYFPNTILNW